MSRIQVGRNTPYGNPIKIGSLCPRCGQIHQDAGATLACYKLYLFWRITGNGPGRLVAKRVRLPGYGLGPREFRALLRELEGKVLVCSGCGIDAKNCHARILENALAWLKSWDIR